MILLLTLLTIKHFLLDFLYQPAYQWQNKGTYGHLGGVLHAGQHSLATLVLLSFFTPLSVALWLSVIEFFIHYHMDWFKMWYNARKGWRCNTSPEFWVLTGFDQMIHSLTYIGIVYALHLSNQ